MSERPDLRADIPAYVASRLDEDDRRRLEEHLQGCPDCTEMVATARAIRGALRAEEGDVDPARDAEAAPHPDRREVRSYALAHPSERSREVARHLARCLSCDLEVAAWQARRSRASGPSSVDGTGGLDSRQRWRARASAAVFLAAGVAIGVVLAQVLRPGAPAVIPPPGPAPSAGSPPAAVKVPRSWTGPVRFFALANPLRAGEREPEIVLDPDQPYALIVVQPDLSELASGDQGAVCHVEIRGAAGGVVWSSEFPATLVRERLRTDEALILPVPAPALPDGRYEMTIRIQGMSGEPLRTEIPFALRRSRS